MSVSAHLDDRGHDSKASVFASPRPRPADVVPLDYREVLKMWLRWNEAFDMATSEMFRSSSQNEVENELDRVDRLRAAAKEMSLQLLARDTSREGDASVRHDPKHIV